MTRRFAIGDEVTVRDATSMFHTRTQAFTRGRTGTVVEFRPDWVIPEDEAWGRDAPERGGRTEPFYVVRFRQTDLWPRYTGSTSTLSKPKSPSGGCSPPRRSPQRRRNRI